VSDARIIPFFTTMQTDQNVVPSESEEDVDEYADETTTEAPSDTIELRDGNIYNIDTDTVTGEQLLAMGYNSEEANEILKKFCPF
jgi:division protein CdvB (Snf7/Vps24/ESCRT-III family)